MNPAVQRAALKASTEAQARVKQENAAYTELSTTRLRELLDYDPSTGIFTWRFARGPNAAGAIAGFDKADGYRAIKIDGVCYLAHRLAWLYVHGCFPSGYLDHKDRQRNNNQLNNLRPATNAENQQNTVARSDSTSGFKGVSWHGATQSWVARISNNGQRVHLGCFSDPAVAYAAYCQAAQTIHSINPAT